MWTIESCTQPLATRNIDSSLRSVDVQAVAEIWAGYGAAGGDHREVDAATIFFVAAQSTCGILQAGRD